MRTQQHLVHATVVRPFVVVLTLLLLIIAITPLPASAAPLSSSAHAHIMHSAANPHRINPKSCSLYERDVTSFTEFGADIGLTGTLENCSGVILLDTIQWQWYSGPGVILSSWYLYHSCGDWVSEDSGSPNRYLGYGSATYTIALSDKVNASGCDIDSDINYGGTINQDSECL